jgi:hypothetical protein
MFDYNSWLKEAERFTSNIAQFTADFEEVKVESLIQPPLDEETLQGIVARVGVHIPGELQNFWLQAARSCDCRYVCRDAKGDMAKRVEHIFGYDQEFYGGVHFFDPIELPEYLVSCQYGAEIFEEDPDPAQQALWLNALPFQPILNGDYLGLDTSTAHDNPPVVYLAHDDKSQIIAPSFTSFLQTWAELCYIGPESWMLEPFQDKNGLIDGTSQKAALWRTMLHKSD